MAGPKLPDSRDPLPALREETRREGEADRSLDDDDSGDPFAAFTEWASPEEDEAWKDL
ncbi:MAG TPA: hypothetical protein VJ526_15150 [Beijerinckiaceae bacterium]|nr:hypothetical protein [Beijerinckiaceae bacterium]